MEIFALYLLLGAFAGTFAGLLGIGGGLIIVPTLIYLFRSQGFAPEVVVHLAVGTALATIVPTSLSSMLAHHRRGAVRWPVFWLLTPGIIIGVLLGAAIAGALPSRILRSFFGVFALAVATQLALNRTPSPHRQLPGRAGMFGAGSIIGAVSGIVGLGGGSLTVPFLVWCNVNAREAVATSAACGFPIAVFGTIGFVASGWEKSGLPHLATGHVYWPAVIGVALASVLFAPLGARLAHTLPIKLLKRLFALFLAVISVKLLLG